MQSFLSCPGTPRQVPALCLCHTQQTACRPSHCLAVVSIEYLLLSIFLVLMQKFTEKSMEFQRKIIERSGLGDETYLPEGEEKPQGLSPATHLDAPGSALHHSAVAMHVVGRNACGRL